MTAVVPRRIAFALLLAALVLAASLTPRTPQRATAEPGVVRVPCRPVVVGGRAECTGTADIPPGTREVFYEPATGAEAAMVRRQLLDARGGMAP